MTDVNPWRSLRGLPRDLYVIAFATLVNRAGTMVLPFLVLYLTDSVGLSPELAGGILISYGVAGLLSAPLAGWLCDRIGAVRVAAGSLLSSSVLFGVYPLAQTPVQVVIASAALAFCGEAFRPASLAMFGERAGSELKKPAFALQRLAINIGMSVGPALGGLLAVWWFPAIFLVDGATSLLSAIVLLIAVDSSHRAPNDAASDEPGDTSESARGASPTVESEVAGGPFTNRTFLYFLAGMLCVAFVFFQMHAALPLYLVRELKMSEAAYGALFTINTALIITLEVPLNSAIAAWSHRRTLVLGAVLTGVGMSAVVFASGFVTVAATVVVWTFGEMILFPSSAAYVSDLARPRARGSTWACTR